MKLKPFLNMELVTCQHMKPCGSRECEVREAYYLAREEDGKVEIGLNEEKMTKIILDFVLEAQAARMAGKNTKYAKDLAKALSDNLENLIEVER